MAQAFTDVSEIELFGEHLREAVDITDERVADFVAESLDNAADRMRSEIPLGIGSHGQHERESVTVELDSDGLGGSVGPTETDPKGKPTGFFLQYGHGSVAPNDFIGRTTAYIEKAIKPEAEALVEGLL